MKIGYYPGCALEGSSMEYSMSVERVMKELGVELMAVRDWNCCGASAAHSTNHKLSVALPFRNLAIAKEQGLTEVFAPCPFCSKTLINTNAEVTEKTALQAEMKEVTGQAYDGSVQIVNSVAIFSRLIEQISSKVIAERLKDLKVACYYGCLLVRPPKLLKYDEPEQPTSMDEIVKKIGAVPVEWEYRVLRRRFYSLQ